VTAWTTAALRHWCTSIKDGTHCTHERVADGVPLLSAKNVLDGTLSISEDESLISAVTAREIAQGGHFRPGDVLLTIVGSIGRCTVLDRSDVVFQRSVASLRPGPKLEARFLMHLLWSPLVRAELEARTKQSAQGGVYLGDLASIAVAVPDRDTQRHITAFLDRKTAGIDQLIQKKERLIELLQEKRQALITQAVTKGLDPSVPMKDSRVEWLGEIPAHWDVKPLKHLSPGVTVGIVVTPSKYYVDVGVPALRSLNVRSNGLEETDLVFISHEGNELHKKSKLRAGDLVVVRTGQPGTAAVIPDSFDGCNCVDLIIIRQSPGFDSGFLCHTLAADPCRAQYGAGAEGAIQQHFNVETAGNLLLAVPPRAEQVVIRERLQAALDHLDGLVAMVAAHIDLLREYRQALISAAVTGQIDVGQEAAS
jgi:type I restriction enzyme, S subunit